MADLVLNTRVSEEACPINLAPTTSTTVMLALSDALALAVMEVRHFTPEDFARYHPSGTLGKRLLLTVQDTMRPLQDIAVVTPSAEVLEITRAITQAGVGGACVVENERLLGFVSDGDIRRVIAAGTSLNTQASEIMSSKVTTIAPHLLAVEGLEFFQNLPKKLGELPVMHEEKLVGLLVLKDLLRSGII
jgi:arabinose-5-phosphate isomerase